MTKVINQASILYYLDSFDDQTTLIAGAQQKALKLDLPFAVVATVEKNDLLVKVPQLTNLETKLTKYKIPLLVLIGKPEAVLPGLYHHVKPRHVFNGNSSFPDETTNLLRPHPQSWPGRVISVAELEELVKEDTATCL